MKILGVNTSHNCSFAIIDQGKVKKYYEEERLNKIKTFTNYDKDYKYLTLKKFKNIKFDCVAISSYGRYYDVSDDAINYGLLKQVKHKHHYFNWFNHHIYHAVCGYYFSKFNKAIAIVRDGGGEQIKQSYQAIDSIYYIDQKEVFPFYRLFSNRRQNWIEDGEPDKKIKYFKHEGADCVLTTESIGGYEYLLQTERAGFKPTEEGQLMGSAAYPGNTIAKQAQEKTLHECIELVKRAMKYSSCKNIILSGGYHLNCSNNFKLVKKFPNLNFFVDPVPYDGGTAIGVALYYENYKK
tara:strand:+ start:357 stop:1241 length:885 start_codon:yes stop_codon:yes gene_type:complete